MSHLNKLLKRHATGAIARGEAEPIIEIPTKDCLLARRDLALALARELQMKERQARKRHASIYGDAGFPNRFPISGGVCDHWPESAKESVCAIVHAKQDATGEALRLHCAAGKRLVTFRRLLSETHHLI